MPIFEYYCNSCNNRFEKIVMKGWENLNEPDSCPKCNSPLVEKCISNPSFRTGGKDELRSVPDPVPPLQKLKEEGPREVCTGGYEDLPEFKPTKRTKDKHGNVRWDESKKQYFT